jgi:hypothetical protein
MEATIYIMRRSTKLSILKSEIKIISAQSLLNVSINPYAICAKRKIYLLINLPHSLAKHAGKHVCINHVYISVVKGQYHFYDSHSCAPNVVEINKEYNVLTNNVISKLNLNTKP